MPTPRWALSLPCRPPGYALHRDAWLGGAALPLPASTMASCSLLGAFGLTEPLHGSDSIALETTAVRDGDSWVLNGEKWIGNGASGGVTVIYARMEDGNVGGFIVPQDAPGYSATVIAYSCHCALSIRRTSSWRIAAFLPPTGCPAAKRSRTSPAC